MNATRPFRRTAIVAAFALAALGGIAVTDSTSPASAQAPVGLGAGGEYHPLTPARIFDSRNSAINDTAPLGKKPTNAQGLSFNVDILGQGGIPTEVDGTNRDVLAVVVNVTAVGATRDGYLSIAPTGAPAGESSLVNFNAGEAVPNLAVIGVGSGGQSTITVVTPSGSGNVDVLVDVFGWISTSSYVDAADTGGRFIPLAPSRLLDTRSTPVPAGWAGGTPLGTMGQLTLPIRGANGVVPGGADVTGVMVNITAVNDQPQSVPTFVSVTPTPTPGGQEPSTSVTNVAPGQVKANMAIVPVGDDGNIHIYNRSGATHVIVDVLGYLQRGVDASTRAGRVVPLAAPFRAFDTRQAAFANTPLGFGSKEAWSFQAFVDSVIGSDGAALGKQSALIGNLTGTGLTPLYPGRPVNTYLSVYPGTGNPPNSSNINVTVGRSVPNMSLLSYPTSGDPYTMSAFNFDGQLHYLLDVYAVVLAD